jgi:hypothetical protein
MDAGHRQGTVARHKVPMRFIALRTGFMSATTFPELGLIASTVDQQARSWPTFSLLVSGLILARLSAVTVELCAANTPGAPSRRFMVGRRCLKPEPDPVVLSATRRERQLEEPLCERCRKTWSRKPGTTKIKNACGHGADAEHVAAARIAGRRGALSEGQARASTCGGVTIKDVVGPYEAERPCGRMQTRVFDARERPRM